MEKPEIASREEWQQARDDLLTAEKEATRALDAIAARRRRLPMVSFGNDYTFDTPAGKTTLLNMIAAIDRPTSGELLVMGENIFRLNDSQSAHWRNTHVGYVFQTFNLIPVLTAFENVELPLLLTKMTTQQRRDHVMTALKLVGLEDRVHHLPKQLSGGQEQRVAIARAIVSDPTLILADEPTGDLDSNSATEILEILKRLNSSFNKTIVMVTHDPHAAQYAHVTRHLEKGRLLPA